MISKQQIQNIRALERKRERDECGCFLAEGDKLVREALSLPGRSPFRVRAIYGLAEWLKSNLAGIEDRKIEVVPVSMRELERLSLLKAPNQVLAVISRNPDFVPEFDFKADLLLGLDRIQDPGNMGTIIRLADWFGLGGIIACANSADFFSPKVVQSSMGSVFRVKLLTADLYEFVESANGAIPVYGTHLAGHDIYSAKLSANGIILLGNESRGLSDTLADLATMNLRIPDFSIGPVPPESLNVSIAAAVVCSEFRRRGTG